MGLISRVSSRTYRKKLSLIEIWLSTSTACYQTRTSANERPGPSSPRPTSTNQLKKSLADQLVPPKPPLSLPAQSPVNSAPLFSAQPSDTTPGNDSAVVSLSKKSKPPVSHQPPLGKSVSQSTRGEGTNLPKTDRATSNA